MQLKIIDLCSIKKKKNKFKSEAVQCVIFPKWLLFLDENKFYLNGNFEPGLLNSISVTQISKYPVNFNLSHITNYHDSKGEGLELEVLMLRMQWTQHTWIWESARSKLPSDTTFSTYGTLNPWPTNIWSAFFSSVWSEIISSSHDAAGSPEKKPVMHSKTLWWEPKCRKWRWPGEEIQKQSQLIWTKNLT